MDAIKASELVVGQTYELRISESGVGTLVNTDAILLKGEVQIIDDSNNAKTYILSLSDIVYAFNSDVNKMTCIGDVVHLPVEVRAGNFSATVIIELDTSSDMVIVKSENAIWMLTISDDKKLPHSRRIHAGCNRYVSILRYDNVLNRNISVHWVDTVKEEDILLRDQLIDEAIVVQERVTLDLG